jgi:hypothetical protein
VSSTDFRGLVPASNDSTLQLIVALMKKLAKNTIANQIELIDSDNEDIYSNGQDMDTVIKYHSELSSTHRFDFLTEYFPPFEPDGDIVKMWLRGNNTGNTTQDYSGFDRFATIYGDPTLVDGTIDLGIMVGGSVKSIARRMNRPTSDYENLEWMQVPDSGGIQVTDQTIGTSIFVRFRLFSLVNQGGKSPTIFEKIDDSTPNNGIMLQARDDGKLVFIIKRGGTTVAKETAAATVTTNTIYDVFVTFTVSGSVSHIYVNGVDKTLTTFGGSVNWQGTLTNHDFFIFRRGLGDDGGFVYGDFYDLKYYRNRVITQQEVTNHYTNKWTISDIAFGHVMITNYWATAFAGGGLGGPSFTSGSFTPLSFEV